MSIQTLPSSGSLASQLGSSFGKGLSEQLPEGIKRGRISAALENLEGKNLTPLQQISNLTSSGASDQQIATLLPLIQQMQQRQRFVGEEQIPQRVQEGQIKPIERQQVSSAQITSPQDLARRLWTQNPSMFTSIPEAENYASSKIQNASNEFDRLKDKFLQTSGNESYKDVVGELEEDYRNKVLNSINARGDEIRAANQIGKEMLRFAKTRGDLATDMAKGTLAQSPKSAIPALKSIQDEYQKVGRPDLFYNDLISGGMSGNYAAALSMPIEKDAETKKILDSSPGAIGKRGFGTSVEFIAHPQKKQINAEQQEKLFEKIQKSQPKSSLGSIGIELQMKGYDPAAFMAYMSQHNELLNDAQKAETQKTDPWQPNLQDIYFFEGVSGVPAWWKRTINFLKHGAR
jgi:hypothetical protein